MAVHMPLVDASATWPPKGSAMTEAIRHTDWSQTPLGSSHQWSACLRIAITTALDSPLPTIVLWGPELLQIYNDAYRPILGLRHPAAMGQATRDCWPEVWQFNQPIYHQVIESGQTVHLEDQAYVIEPSGVPEARYFTVTYAPLRDEGGAVRGVTVIAVETTQRVLMERENQALQQASRFVDDQLRQMFAQAPNFLIVLKGPDHVFEIVNAAGKALFSGRDVIGKSVLQSRLRRNPRQCVQDRQNLFGVQSAGFLRRTRRAIGRFDRWLRGRQVRGLRLPTDQGRAWPGFWHFHQWQ
jgi:hypothetical protein